MWRIYASLHMSLCVVSLCGECVCVENICICPYVWCVSGECVCVEDICNMYMSLVLSLYGEFVW